MPHILPYEKKRTEDSLIEEIQTLYLSAENKIKHLEVVSREMCVPSINELRYAGNHLLKALTSYSNDAKNEHLSKAKSHCKRAIYDAVN